MPRIAVVMTSHAGAAPFPRATGYWREEVSAFYAVAKGAGAEIAFVSPQGGAPPLDQESAEPNKEDNRGFLADATAQSAMAATMKPADVDPASFDAIYFAGGHGAMWDFPEDEALARLTSAVYARGGVVATVCHGAAALLNKHLTGPLAELNNRVVTGFSNLEERAIGQTANVPYALETALKDKGVRYKCALIPFAPYVQVDERLVTPESGVLARCGGGGRAHVA